MSEPIHMAIVRTVKPGCETAFEASLHDFVRHSLSLSGQLGVQVIRPAPGSSSRQYGIIRRFADRDAVTAFHSSPEYLAWNHFVQDLTEGAGHAEELCGLESWFTLPGEKLSPLPKWKLALATYAGVLPVVMGLSLTIGPLLRPLSFVLNNAIFNACVVALLTWVVMPLITRALHPWLHPTPNTKP